MNMYVRNLDYNLQEDELRTIFGEYGEVTSVKIIKDKFTGRGKGFGFVDMKNETDAVNAIDQLNGAEIRGRKIMVNEARPQKTRNNY